MDDATITGEHAPLRYGDDLAKGSDTVLQRHRRLQVWPVVCETPAGGAHVWRLYGRPLVMHGGTVPAFNDVTSTSTDTSWSMAVMSNISVSNYPVTLTVAPDSRQGPCAR
jgi:hypothetical protein